MSGAITEFEPEVVLHLAAQSVVRTGYENPVDTYASNVMGTVNLLEAVRTLKRKCVIVNVTSDKCYENREWVWGYRETIRWGGTIPTRIRKAVRNSSPRPFAIPTFRPSLSTSMAWRWPAREPATQLEAAIGPRFN